MLSNTRASRALDQYFNGDNYYRDLQRAGDPRLNLTLLEIHDWERFLVNFPDRADKARLGLQYLASAPGIPVIYYGLEQGFNSVCPREFAQGVDRGAMEQLCFKARGPTRHPLYRQDMFGSGMFRLGSALPAQAQLAHIGPAGGGQDSVYTDTTHEVYRSARRYNYLRQSCFALRYGGVKWRWSSDESAGVFAFSRIDQANEAVVVVNSADDARNIPSLKLDRAGLKLVDPLDVAQRVSSDGAGVVDFQGLRVEGNSVRIFVEERSLGQRSDYLGTHLCRDIAVRPARKP